MVPDGASNGRPQGERTMCSPSDYAHILANEPSPEERAAMAAIPQEPERRPRDVSDDFADGAGTRSHPTSYGPSGYEPSAKVADRWFCRQHGWHKTGEAHR